MDPLSSADMEYIGNTLFPAIDKKIIAKMVEFNNMVSIIPETPLDDVNGLLKERDFRVLVTVPTSPSQ